MHVALTTTTKSRFLLNALSRILAHKNSYKLRSEERSRVTPNDIKTYAHHGRFLPINLNGHV